MVYDVSLLGHRRRLRCQVSKYDIKSIALPQIERLDTFIASLHQVI